MSGDACRHRAPEARTKSATGTGPVPESGSRRRRRWRCRLRRGGQSSAGTEFRNAEHDANLCSGRSSRRRRLQSGPAMFRLPLQGMNAEMVTAFGILTSMVFANHLNSTTGGAFMRTMGIMLRIPEQRPLASVLVVIHLAICARESRFSVLLFAICFGLPGCLSGRLETSVLPLSQPAY